MPQYDRPLNSEQLKRLTFLQKLRKESQEETAVYFGLQPGSGRNDISEWENGQYVPPEHYRSTFIRYLIHKLDLRDRDQFKVYWKVLEDLWKWPTVTDFEWERAHSTAPNTAPPRPQLIIGRENDLRELKARLRIIGKSQQALSRPGFIVIQGWPGVGKTTVTTALAHDPDIAGMFPDGVLWISLGLAPNLLASLSQWGREIGLTGTDDLLHLNDIEAASSRLRSLLQNKRMLLIVDDVWDVADAQPFKNVVGQKCAMLVTTRIPEVAEALASVPNAVYKLGVLAKEPALALLRELAPEVVKNHHEECSKLVETLEGLPLALQVAGRLLYTESRYRDSVQDLLLDIQKMAKLLEARPPSDRIDKRMGANPTVAALLQTSIECLDLQTRYRFICLGVFEEKPAHFDAAAMKAVWLVNDPLPTIGKLIGHGLLDPLPTIGKLIDRDPLKPDDKNQATKRYWMHAILKAYADSLMMD